MPLDPLADKWRGVSLERHARSTATTCAAIVDALGAVPAAHGPTAIIAHTVKGKGVPGVEGTGRAHYTMLTEDEAKAATAALEAAS